MGNIILFTSSLLLLISLWVIIYIFRQVPSMEQGLSMILAFLNSVLCLGNIISISARAEDTCALGLRIMAACGPFMLYCYLKLCALICRHKIHIVVSSALIALNLITAVVVMSDPLHHFVFKSLTFRTIGPVMVSHREYAFMTYFYVGYVFIYLLLTLMIVLDTKKRKPAFYKNLHKTLLKLIITTLIAYVPHILNLILVPDHDLSCYSSTFALVYFVYTMKREKIYGMRQLTSEFVLNDIDDILLVHDSSGCYEYANRLALETYPVLEDIPINVAIPGLDPGLDTLLSLKDNDYYEINDKSYYCRVIPLNNYSNLKGSIRWLHDITAEKTATNQIIELKDEAERANRAKSAFLAHISHEIRTPINAIIGMDELIMRESREPEIVNYAGRSMRAGQILLSLINNILDFSKIEAGKMELVVEEYEARKMIKDITIMTQFRADEKNLEFYVDISDDIPDTLIGDETRVKQVITNIVTNAVKYTESGSVSLVFTYTDEIMKVVVSDTGIGIKKEDIDKIFVSFERIENKLTHNIEGTGLGMNITASLLNMMNGRIEIESKPGEGSVFTLYIPQKKGTKIIPKKDEQLAGTGRLADTRAIPNNYIKSINIPTQVSVKPVEVNTDQEVKAEAKLKLGQKYQAPDARIIIVDDTKSNLFVASSLLKPTKIKVDTASSGAEFLKKAETVQYDAILMDYWMPVMTGPEAIDALHNGQGINSDTPIIMMTGETEKRAVEDLKEKGLSLYISKPLDPVRYEALIASVLPEEKVLYK